MLRASHDPAVQNAMYKAVHAASLRNRDRMSFETVVELMCFDCLTALPGSTDVVCTLYPESYTQLKRDCPDSVAGLLADMCSHPAGGMYFLSDPKKKEILAMQTHNPVRVTSIAGGASGDGEDGFARHASFSAPAGIVCMRVPEAGTFVFVADSGLGNMRCLDVGPFLNESVKVYEQDLLDNSFLEQVAPNHEPNADLLCIACLNELSSSHLPSGHLWLNPAKPQPQCCVGGYASG